MEEKLGKQKVDKSRKAQEEGKIMDWQMSVI